MVKTAKTMSGADCGSNHEQFVALIQGKLKKTKKQTWKTNTAYVAFLKGTHVVEVKKIVVALDGIYGEPKELW